MRLTDDRIHRLLRQCYLNAQHSDDTKTQNGSVLVVDSVEVAGWNHFAVPQKSYPDDKTKARVMIHAERDCLFRAARIGVRTGGSTMLCVWAPCCQCAQAILSCGVKTLVTHKSMMDRTYEKYQEEVAFGLKMLTDSGVEHINWDGQIGSVTNLMNGEVWNP